MSILPAAFLPLITTVGHIRVHSSRALRQHYCVLLVNAGHGWCEAVRAWQVPLYSVSLPKSRDSGSYWRESPGLFLKTPTCLLDSYIQRSSSRAWGCEVFASASCWSGMCSSPCAAWAPIPASTPKVCTIIVFWGRFRLCGPRSCVLRGVQLRERLEKPITQHPSIHTAFPWPRGNLIRLCLEALGCAPGLIYELRSMLVESHKDMDPDFSSAHDKVPIWNPMSTLTMALLSIICARMVWRPSWLHLRPTLKPGTL